MEHQLLKHQLGARRLTLLIFESDQEALQTEPMPAELIQFNGHAAPTAKPVATAVFYLSDPTAHSPIAPRSKSTDAKITVASMDSVILANKSRQQIETASIQNQTSPREHTEKLRLRNRSILKVVFGNLGAL